MGFLEDKVDNCICFFAKKHFNIYNYHPSQTAIYKYLAFFEYRMQEKTGKMPLDLTYRAMDQGPVPIKIYSERTSYKTKKVEFRTTHTTKIEVVALGDYDPDYFTTEENEELNDIAYIIKSLKGTATELSDMSHEEIKAWQISYKKEENSIIDNTYTFGENLEEKENLSEQEERALIERAIKKMSHLGV